MNKLNKSLTIGDIVSNKNDRTFKGIIVKIYTTTFGSKAKDKGARIFVLHKKHRNFTTMRLCNLILLNSINELGLEKTIKLIRK